MNYMFKLLFTSLLLTSATAMWSQPLSSVATKWADSFVAWDLYGLEKDTSNADEPVYEEVQIGTLQQRWIDVREDWTEWDFTLNGQDGTIKIKWKNDPSQWELRTFDGDIVTMKTIWSGDYTEWRITNNSLSFDLKSRYTNDYGEWSVANNKHGDFKVSVASFNDPRDWNITDEMDDEVVPALKLAMLFIVIYHASPKQ